MDPNDNPFNPGAGVAPPELVGRNYLTSEIEVALARRASGRHDKHMLIIGLRGVGKTVLLNHACSMAQTMGYMVIFVETDARRAGAFTQELALQITEILPHLTKGLAARALDKLRQALSAFSMTITPDGPSFRVETSPSTDNPIPWSGNLASLFVAVGEAAAERKLSILIAVDEVQDIPDEDLSSLIAAAHRADQLLLPILLIGAGLPNLPGKTGDAKTYSERLFQFPRLGPLKEEEAKEALAIPAERVGVKFQKAALNQIVAASEGYPYFVQEWGKRTWNAASGSTITSSDVKVAEPIVETSLDENFYNVRVGRLTPKEMEYLHAMAQLGQGPYNSAEIAAKLGTTTSSLSARRNDLIEKGMIYSPSHGNLAFSVPLFEKHLQRTI